MFQIGFDVVPARGADESPRRTLPIALLVGLLSLAVIGCATDPMDSPGGTAGSDGASSGGKEDGASGDSTPACQAAEVCDGVADEDCDGAVDEDCGRCPLMTVSCPTGCCPIDSVQLGTAQTTGSEIAVDGAGNIFYAYTTTINGGWYSTLAIYDALPGTWRQIPLGGGSYRNRIRIDAMDRVHVANVSNDYPQRLMYRRSDDHGATFTTPISVGIINGGDGFDMEIDSADQPHIVYEGDDPYSYSSDIRYTHLVGSTWSTEILDPDTDSGRAPDLELGFADRPRIVYVAYKPPGATGEAKRYVFFNGNHWIGENIDVAGSSSYPGDPFFSAHTLRVLPDDSREVLFMRHDGPVGPAGDKLILAQRGPLDADTWHETEITGATGVLTPTMFVDDHGKRAAVSDGVRLHREDSATSWTTTDLGVMGRDVALARRGRYLYLAFPGYSPTTSTTGPPTVKVIDLGPGSSTATN